jgi:hypothetical protein
MLVVVEFQRFLDMGRKGVMGVGKIGRVKVMGDVEQ